MEDRLPPYLDVVEPGCAWLRRMRVVGRGGQGLAGLVHSLACKQALRWRGRRTMGQSFPHFLLAPASSYTPGRCRRPPFTVTTLSTPPRRRHRIMAGPMREGRRSRKCAV